MNPVGILKPEYFYQPRRLFNRLFSLVHSRKNFESKNPEFVIEKLSWGMPIRVRPEEEHGKIVSIFGVIDLVVSETLWRLVNPAETVVDVGANIGYMTALLATRADQKPGGAVVAFEAHPEVFLELDYNVNLWQSKLNHVKIKIYEVAVSNQEGQVALNVPTKFKDNRGLSSIISLDCNDFISERSSIVVKSTTLDNVLYNFQNIHLLKVDVEGHELKVFQGTERMLSQNRIRDCVFEEHHPYPTDVTRLFEAMGYKVFRLHRHFLGPVLLPANSSIPRSKWEPTSFLATLQPERVINCFKPRGWQILSHRLVSVT